MCGFYWTTKKTILPKKENAHVRGGESAKRDEIKYVLRYKRKNPLKHMTSLYEQQMALQFTEDLLLIYVLSVIN